MREVEGSIVYSSDAIRAAEVALAERCCLRNVDDSDLRRSPNKFPSFINNTPNPEFPVY
jgi:hypothetical protein